MIAFLVKHYRSLTKQQLLLWLFLIVFIFPGIPFVLGSIGILLYANWPSSAGVVTHAPIKSDISKLWLVTHGKGDNANTWVLPMVAELKKQADQQTQVIAIDWQEGAQSLLRCSRNASVIGEELAETALKNTQLQQVHFIAHSAGSFMAYQFCKTLKKYRKDIQVSITYLDPVSVYRGLWWNYGVQHFGRCADASIAYINSDDAVPGSNVQLDFAKTIDVTALKPKDFSNGHVWPVEYFYQQQRLKNQ